MIRRLTWVDGLEDAGSPAEEARLSLMLTRLKNAGIDVHRWDPLTAPASCELPALPALVIDEECKCAGRQPTAEEWRQWIDFDALPRGCSGCAACGGCAGCPGKAVCHGK